MAVFWRQCFYAKVIKCQVEFERGKMDFPDRKKWNVCKIMFRSADESRMAMLPNYPGKSSNLSLLDCTRNSQEDNVG